VSSDGNGIDSAAERIARETGIPPCPAIVTRLLRETREDDPDFQRIGKLIAADVGLAATVVNLANSPFYGLRTKAGSVHHAITMLGVSTIAQVVVRLVLRQAFPTASGSVAERYWKTSTATAVIGAHIARETRQADGEMSHTYILFRDCGILILMQRSNDYAALLRNVPLLADGSIQASEIELFGATHAQIGAQLARGWQLSEALSDAIGRHHEVVTSAEVRARTSREALVLTATGLAADRLYADWNRQECREWSVAQEWALPLLGLSPDALSALAERVGAALKSGGH